MTLAGVAPDIENAIKGLEQAMPGRVSVDDSDEGGTVIRIAEIELSSRWSPRSGDLWFVIPFHYPDAPIYPYYVSGATPVGGLVDGLQTIQWRGMEMTQVSLRHNGWNPNFDTALGSVMQTRAWLLEQ